MMEFIAQFFCNAVGIVAGIVLVLIALYFMLLPHLILMELKRHHERDEKALGDMNDKLGKLVDRANHEELKERLGK